ncbi:hypothetical protein CapIbe_013215 [Capra ibex]
MSLVGSRSQEALPDLGVVLLTCRTLISRPYLEWMLAYLGKCSASRMGMGASDSSSGSSEARPWIPE